ncbi:prolyl 4-hydroxylase subunit alpha-1-like [Drosophila nasuta]|uniref:prolyl 4-hydroxylase subunit alpha-1-like n=1 Tax=Drosophila nasuta TaxID=42062 RepID=UPI00295E7933|nr:prolyl 4-hydroxylase subunit alpha-1-like [Drosophila nasuta]
MFHLSAFFFTLCLVIGNINAEEEETDPQKLLELEKVFVEQLEAYMAKADKIRANINRFLAYVDVVHDDLDDPEAYFGNPINSFTTISRLVNNWKREVIDVILTESAVDEHHKQVAQEVVQMEIEHPTENDLQAMTNDILQYQGQNDLPTAELANDVLYSNKEDNQSITLTASDCYAIGRSCHKLELSDFAVEWLMEARSLLAREPVTFASITDVQILQYLAPTLQELGNLKLANILNNEILKADPKHEEALKAKVDLEKKLLLGRLTAPIVETNQ